MVEREHGQRKEHFATMKLPWYMKAKWGESKDGFIEVNVSIPWWGVPFLWVGCMVDRFHNRTSK